MATYMTIVQDVNNTKPIVRLQNISLIVCIKRATKLIVIVFPLQNDMNGALDVGVYQIYFA